MAAEQRKLLEQLMGADALVGRSSKRQEILFTDTRVCKSYLVGTCPHDLFTNTKQDFGPCPKIHSEAHKAEYQRERERGREFPQFEYEYTKDLEKYIFDCNRRIDAAQRRLERTPDEIAQTTALLKAIDEINEGIDASVMEISILGPLSLLQRALTELHAIKVLRHEREAKERDLRNLNDNMGPSGHQKLQVCDVCGAYLSRLDNDRRLADHFAGKMHLGYAQMRAAYKELQQQIQARRSTSGALDSYSSGANNSRSDRSDRPRDRRDYDRRDQDRRDNDRRDYDRRDSDRYDSSDRWSSSRRPDRNRRR
ncbi:uncharacterized protein V1518DRAFT_413036 [Limtongia smithiae]|uniref:uncharacterized protein n=1 Tax=Limtongia smithiae TaxID=1125753 RepID=UPI0034CE2814